MFSENESALNVAASLGHKWKLPVAGLWFPLQEEEVVKDDAGGVPTHLQQVQQKDVRETSSQSSVMCLAQSSAVISALLLHTVGPTSLNNVIFVCSVLS